MRAHAPTVTLRIAGEIASTDLDRLYGRACQLLQSSDAAIIRCDVREAPADAATVDALTHVTLAARRLGREVEVSDASDELRQLIVFMGLADVLRPSQR